MREKEFYFVLLNFFRVEEKIWKPCGQKRDQISKESKKKKKNNEHIKWGESIEARFK